MAREPPADNESFYGWRQRWTGWRNRVIASPRFQNWAARNLLTRSIARRRSVELFDLLAGFTYTQALLATVESGLLDLLASGAANASSVATHCQLPEDAAVRLLRAAAAIGLADEVGPDVWMLGEQGAALHGNRGARAMIAHHRLLYADLADPLALLRDNRGQPTALSRFWTYVDPAGQSGETADVDGAYSALMADSQALVAEQVLAAHDIGRYQSLLDVGGGYGTFAQAVLARHPDLRIGLFDLPDVVSRTAHRLDAPDPANVIELHPGNFFAEPIPRGYACVSLVRILHDHDDGPALELLRRIREALAPGACLLVAEPMAGVRGAERMGDAYFGLYLWAMRSGRPRTSREIGTMLKQAGFSRWKRVRVDLPVICSLIVATA